MDLSELKKEYREITTKMKSLNDLCITENRGFSEAEDSRYNDLDGELDKLKARINNVELNDGLKIPTPVIDQGNNGGFRNLGEFINAVSNEMVWHTAGHDNRLDELRQSQSLGEGQSGGYMVPTQYKPDLMQVSPGEAIVRPRATIIPAGSPPDAEITFPVLDQTASKNIYGGVTVAWIGEADTKPQTSFALKEKAMIPHEVAAHIVVTDKLIRNWPACEATVGTLLRKAVIGAEDMSFLTGNGVAKPKGIIHSNAVISTPRGAAATITFADITTMLSRFKFGGSPVWIASQTVIPQLLALVDPGSAGTLIWQMNAVNPMPGTILGIPLILNDRSPALGTLGDFILADLKYYVIKDGSGPFVAASPHVHFTANKTVIKVFWNVDGDSWLDEALPLEGATGETVSPFITLAE